MTDAALSPTEPVAFRPAPEILTVERLGVPHGFFTRLGGVSGPPFDSLNCSLSSKDDPKAVAANRAIVAGALGVAPEALLAVTQVHGPDVVTATDIWPVETRPSADALVTVDPRLALGIITADCAPVLFASADGRVVGAAHAGWRGACGGVLEATLEAMRALGAEGIVCAVGPCIAQASYQVGSDMRADVLSQDADAAAFFRPDGERFRFDLSGYCADRLRRAGAESAVLSADTFPDTRRFFSHRRRTLAGGGPIGHQISAIRPRD